MFSLIGGRRSFAGSMIGGIALTQEMLDFCAEHGIGAEVEVIAADQVNEAYERVLASDVRYRFVIDTAHAWPDATCSGPPAQHVPTGRCRVCHPRGTGIAQPHRSAPPPGCSGTTAASSNGAMRDAASSCSRALVPTVRQVHLTAATSTLQQERLSPSR